MDRVREVCSTGSALRKAAGLRVRLPLASLTVVTDDAASAGPLATLDHRRAEREVARADRPGGGRPGGVRGAADPQVNARVAGPRLGRDVQKAIKASKSGDWSVAAEGVVTAGGIALQEGEYALQPSSPTPIPMINGRSRCCPAAAS